MDLNKRIAGQCGNTTLVVLVSAHEDVTLVTPGGAPRVLDDVVVLRVLATITNSQNTVIELSGRALGLVVDTRFVELEGSVRSIDGNRDGTNGGNGSLEIAFALGFDINESLWRGEEEQ